MAGNADEHALAQTRRRRISIIPDDRSIEPLDREPCLLNTHPQSMAEAARDAIAITSLKKAAAFLSARYVRLLPAL
jgi:hypothetical protein